ncbi:hypothetical protein SAMN06297251_1332 [Fulvimarina manganoxydans]|uniref:Lipase (Class 3) n=1 Tax=Fulvimarina manganoxydans TaxID=937218 RepID=A0A1W2EST5_9HYPH|nr:hypothetical protein [Fulvimarina manganoxydans]SMD12757.1 hypothetical protein SAMN06297251_1332 [Fulvimarina manganoxydans]
MASEMIQRRLVFLFPGFEPMGVEAHVARFRRASERSAKAFGVDVSFEEPTNEAKDLSFATLTARLKPQGAGGETRTDIVFCDWSDLIRSYEHRPLPVRVARGFAGLFDFIATGTVIQYLKTSWRYIFFFLYPFVAVLLALLVGLGLFISLDQGFSGPTTGLVAGLIGLAAAAGLLWQIDRRWHLRVALDDWALAADMCRSRNPAIEERVTRFAETIQERAQAAEIAGTADEIVVAAHSLGACYAVPALAKAFEAGFAPRVPLHVLTVGSSLMKTALHPAAAAQREAVRRLLVDHGLPWTDCQGLSDPINFYKSNPATSLGIAADPVPLIVKVRFRHMVSRATYRRIKRDFFRLHRQFVLAVENRCAYSLHMLLLGPASLTQFRQTRSVDRPPLVAPEATSKRPLADKLADPATGALS